MMEAISRLRVQNLSLEDALLILLGYAFKYAYSLPVFVNTDMMDQATRELYLRNFFPWFSPDGLDWLQIPLMDSRNYVYLLGERFFVFCIVLLLHKHFRNWPTLFICMFHGIYILDFLVVFHASPVGTVSIIAIFVSLYISLKEDA